MDRAPIDSALILTTTRLFNRPRTPLPARLVARVRKDAGNGEPLVVVRDCKPKHKDGPPTLALPLTRYNQRATGAPGGGMGGGDVRTLSAVVLSKDESVGVATTLETPATTTLDVDLVVIPEGFTASGWAGPQDSPYPVHAALERAIRQGQVRVLPLGSDWYQDVCAEGRSGPAEAEQTLIRSLKGGLEGFVDRHFNRRCSRWITRWLLRTPLTPNGVTVLATAVGVLASVSFGVGGYAAGHRRASVPTLHDPGLL